MQKIEKNAHSRFEQQVSYYQAQNCQVCLLRWGSHKVKGERIIEVNHKQERHK